MLENDNSEPLAEEVAALIEEFTEALERGEAPEIDAFAERYPEYSEKIRNTLQVLMSLEDLDAVHLEKAEKRNAPHSIGEFRLLREVGRGGMGVVYEALQGSLERRVALKVLPLAGLADERQLQRFKNEARAVATLHHNNIIPIHSVGNDRGTHYIAMQFVEGCNLADVINDLSTNVPTQPSADSPTNSFSDGKPSDSVEAVSKSSEAPKPQNTEPVVQAEISTAYSNSPREYYRSVAKWMERAADGLAHAHENGVVHRDIKPSNLMLDKTGHVWITDFGLARLESDVSLTATGDMLGTLRYMAPEQVCGGKVLIDHRADIYSLGLTMYELLTLKPAFPGNDHSTLLNRITSSEPTAPRQLATSIPHELETIVLKAIEKNPGDRYHSAAGLAEDLHRFLHHHPILAKRPSLAARTAKWAYRHSTVVGSTAAALLIILVTSLGIFWNANQRIRVAMNALENKNDELLAAKQRSNTTLEFARQAIDEVYVEFADEWVSQQSEAGPVQRDFLVSAAEIYTDLVLEYPNDAQLLLRAIEAQLSAANISAEIGKPLEANRWFKQAFESINSAPSDLQLTGKLLALEATAATDYRHHNIRQWDSKYISSSNPWETTEARVHTAVKKMASYLEEMPSDREALRATVHAQTEMLRYQPFTGDLIETAKDAVRNAKTLNRIEPNADSWALLSVALESSLRALAYSGVQLEGKDLAPLSKDFLAMAREVVAAAEAAYELSPTHQNRRLVSKSYGLLADRQRQDKLVVEAVESFQRAIQQQAELVQNFPSRTDYWDGLCAQHQQVCGIFKDLLTSEEDDLITFADSNFEGHFLQALEIEFPEQAKGEANLFKSNVLTFLGICFGFQKNADRAFESFQEAQRFQTLAGEKASAMKAQFINMLATMECVMALETDIPFSLQQRQQMLLDGVGRWARSTERSNGSPTVRRYQSERRFGWLYRVWAYHPDAEIAAAAEKNLLEFVSAQAKESPPVRTYFMGINLLPLDFNMYQEAISQAQEALENDWFNNAYQDHMFWVLAWSNHELGNFDEAITWFREFEATDLFSKEIAPSFQLSELFATIGRMEEARDYFASGLTQIQDSELPLSRGEATMMLRAASLLNETKRTRNLLQQRWTGDLADLEVSQK